MSVQRFWILVVGCFLVLSSACGKPTEKNLCDDVDCELGVCDSTTGTCANPGACGDDAPCLEGYECVSDQCVATFGCDEETECDRGICERGACVNAERCDDESDCVGGFACDGDACVPDACDQVTCERGVCEKSSGDCVNAAVCTAETQGENCLDGFVCYDQTCESETTVCDEIDCARGACDVETLSCINAESCAGDDRNCLDGFICSDDDTCIPNVCEATATDCARGVCEEATGTCVNAESCSALSDCRDGFFCVESACIEQDVACEVCPGNQVCTFDEMSVAVECSENPAGCVNTLDCLGTNVCQEGTCATPAACIPDAQEPNDTLPQATPWFTTAVDGGIAGTVCSGDSDFFAYDLAQDPQFTGTLVAQVAIPASDVGIGTLTLELHDAAGTVVATNTSRIDDRSVRVEHTIGNINQGVYTLAVRDGGDAGVGGIDYVVYMDLVDATAAAACSAAQQAVTGAMGDTSASQSNTLGSNCVVQSTGNDEAWILDVPVAAYVTIDVTGVQFDAVISLRRQCEVDASEIACTNGGGPRVRETLSRQLDAGRYSLVIQGTDGAQSGAYGLQIQQEPIVCTSADNTCADAMTATACNSRGTGFDTLSCLSGCDAATGTCIREVGDVCSTAIDATAGYTGSVSLGLLSDDYDPGISCVSEGFSGSVTDGPDAVFAVTLQDGELLYATADPDSFDYIGMYLVDDCTDVSTSCVLGVNAADYSGTETLRYENATGAAVDYLLVVDSESGANGSVDVQIEVGTPVCTPGSLQCSGALLETCVDSGFSYTGRTCTNGCDPVALRCIPPANDVCTGAIDVSAGGQWTGTIEEYNNDVENTLNCTDWTSDGPDAMYMLTGVPGQIAKVSVAASFDVALYATTSCDDIAYSCIAGDDDGGTGTTEEIEFRLDGTPIYLFVDSISASPSGQFTLDVAVRNADCQTYEQAVACLADGTTLQICNHLGALEDYPCDTTCAGAACDRPTGDRCADAVVLTNGQSFNGNFGNFAADYDPGVGSCILTSSDRQDGPDATFAVDLVAGDLLTASLNSGTTLAGLWVMTDCGDTRDSCLVAAPRAEELTFYASATGRYYLVVDSTSTSSSSDFTVTVDVQSGFACLPGGATCDSTSGSLTVCNASGTAVTGIVNCSNGCRPSGHCEGPTLAPNTCADVAVVNGSVSYLDYYGRFTNEFDPGAVTNACGLIDTDGPDAVYQVSLGAGDVVDVTVDDLGGTGSPRVYIASDCADVATSCLASAGSFSPEARAAFVSQAGGTAYVVVDNTSTTASDPFTVDIDVRPAQCVPGAVQCTGSNSGESCNEYAELVPFECYFGCTNGVCEPPTNDTCATPVDATGGASFSIQIDGYTNTYDPGFSGCTAYYADGPDGVFKVTMAQDEVIEVTADASAFDVAVYLTTTCDDVTTCAKGSDVNYTGSETITFRAPVAGDYFVHVDTSDTVASGRFDLTIDYPTLVCMAGTTACDATGTNIEACNGFGTASESIACDAQGCVAGQSFCTNADGETCAAAIDANAGGTFTGDFTNFDNDYSLNTFDSCTDWSSSGPEAVYYVDLLAGQTLTTTLTSTSDTSLWLSTSCAGAVDACVAGADDSGSGETVSYTAVAAQRVFIFADNYSSTSTATYTLTVAIQ